MAVTPLVTSSQWVGAIVGKFVVGDGTKVGPPIFQPAKPRMTLKGQHFQVNVVADLKQVNLAKARMTLRRTALSTVALNISSTVSPSPTNLTKLTLKGKPNLRIVTPGRQITGKPRMTLRGKTYRLNRSHTPRPGKAKMILRGGAITKVGKAGLVPSVPVSELLVPTAVQDYGSLAPAPASEDGLLVPTTVEYV